MNGEISNMIQKPQKTLLESLASFDWRGAGIVLGILGMAGTFYLAHFFITREQYDTDQNHLREMLNFRFDQVQKTQEESKHSQDETRKDVKDILTEQRKANK